MASRRISPVWFWSAWIWFGVGLFDALQTVFVMRAEGMHHNWGFLFITVMLSWLPWAIASPLILPLGRRYPPVRLLPFSTWGVHAGACALIGIAAAAWTAWLEMLMNPWARA